MDNGYIRELVKTLEQTEFWDRNVRKYDYDEGIERLVEVFAGHRMRRSGVFFIGNGGSSAIASHMTADFMKNGGMRTCSLYDHAVMTCLGNDYGYPYLFAKQLKALSREGDLLAVISSSGNSPNIIKAIEAAREKKAAVLTLTGFTEDNRAKQMGDFNIYVPCMKYGIVESIHNLILQQAVDVLMKRDGADR